MFKKFRTVSKSIDVDAHYKTFRGVVSPKKVFEEASAGILESMILASEMLYFGNYVDEDKEFSTSVLYQLAFGNRSSNESEINIISHEAAYILSKIFIREKKFSEAHIVLEALHQRNFLAATTKLGELYFKIEATYKNEVLAINYLKNSANRKHFAARILLAQLYWGQKNLVSIMQSFKWMILTASIFFKLLINPKKYEAMFYY